jgi:hypothetical protein
MYRLLYFLYQNRNDLKTRFLCLAFYRKCYRIKYKLSYIDFEDKLFLSLLFFNSIIGLYTVLSVINPSLRLVEIYIAFPLLSFYLYISYKKIIGTVYYHRIWLACMLFILLMNSSAVILDVLYYEGLLLQHENDEELSFIGKYLIDSISFLFKVLEKGNFSLCSPAELPVELQKGNTKPFIDFAQGPYRKVKTCSWDAITRGIGVGLFTHTMTKNPRLTYAVAGTTAVFSFISDIIDD